MRRGATPAARFWAGAENAMSGDRKSFTRSTVSQPFESYDDHDQDFRDLTISSFLSATNLYNSSHYGRRRHGGGTLRWQVLTKREETSLGCRAGGAPTTTKQSTEPGPLLFEYDSDE